MSKENNNILETNIKFKLIKGLKHNNESLYNPLVTNISNRTSMINLSKSNSLKNYDTNDTASLKNFYSASRLRKVKDNKTNNINYPLRSESIIEKIYNSPSPVIKRNRINLDSPYFKNDFKSKKIINY